MTGPPLWWVVVVENEEEEEEEEEEEKKEAQHFHLYSDVMRDIQLIQLKDKVDLHVPSMTFATLIQMYPEFKEPTCHRALKKSGQKGMWCGLNARPGVFGKIPHHH